MDWNAVINYEDNGYTLYYECPVCSEIQSTRLDNCIEPLTLSRQREHFAVGVQYRCRKCRSVLSLLECDSSSDARRSRWFMVCSRRYTLKDWLEEGFGD